MQCSVTLPGRVMLIGQNTYGPVKAQVDIFDMGSSKWITGPAPTTARIGHSCAVVFGPTPGTFL